jgi:L-seryl-tRNA(Ser) seleniumtransferase
MPAKRKKSVDLILRKIPSVDSFLENELKSLRERFSHKAMVAATRAVLALERKRLTVASGKGRPRKRQELFRLISDRLGQESRRALTPVVNATGIILHTNLGRALLPEEALTRLTEVAMSYCTLEYDLDEGKRTQRGRRLSSLVCDVTGAEDALVVNNNAGAVLLVLDTFARDKEVVIPRGDLIEIGGSFRLPEIMAKGGATLVEVGTTNRTYLADYEGAITENTAILMKAHWSNYVIQGYVESVELSDLAELGRRKKILVFEDMGSGALVNLSEFGFGDEPWVKRSLATGVHLISFSGDKLVGGPQAGVIVGKKEYIRLLRQNQLARALRVDKFTIAALEAVLEIYVGSEPAVDSLPVYRMILQDEKKLKQRGQRIVRAIEDNKRLRKTRVGLIETVAGMGGGALPGVKLPSYAVSVEQEGKSAQSLAKALRMLPKPVVGRVSEDSVLLDLRTVLPSEDRQLVQAIGEIETV